MGTCKCATHNVLFSFSSPATHLRMPWKSIRDTSTLSKPPEGVSWSKLEGSPLCFTLSFSCKEGKLQGYLSIDPFLKCAVNTRTGHYYLFINFCQILWREIAILMTKWNTDLQSASFLSDTKLLLFFKGNSGHAVVLSRNSCLLWDEATEEISARWESLKTDECHRVFLHSALSSHTSCYKLALTQGKLFRH